MLKNIIYVEDGSVDLEELEKSFDEETKVIVYQKGTQPPLLVQPEKPISSAEESQYKKTLKLLDWAREKIEEIFKLRLVLPGDVENILNEIHTELM